MAEIFAERTGPRQAAFALATATVCALAGPAEAEAQRFVIIGGGRTVTHIADFDERTAPVVSERYGFEEPAVGFVYEYFSMFFLDLWTGAGKVALYDRGTEAYVEVDEAELRELTGRSADDFGKPFLYRFPLGWLAVTLVIGGVVFSIWRRWREIPV